MIWNKLGTREYWGTKYNLVQAIALIRDNTTGEVVEYPTEELLEEGEASPSDFNWSENNYSCDCNRRLFFQRVKGVKEEDDVPCSDGLFSVNLKNALTGEVYYKEFE